MGLVRVSPVAFLTLLAFPSTQVGCSFVMVSGPPSDDLDRYDPEGEPPCTPTRAWPIMDLVLAGASAGSGLAVAAATAERQTLRDRFVIGGGLAMAAILAVSSFWGFSATGACRDYLLPRQSTSARPGRPSTMEDEPTSPAGDP